MRQPFAIIVALGWIALIHGPLLAAEQSGEETSGRDEAGQTKASHAMSYFGSPKYPEGFSHFDYANPDAPKTGTVRMYMPGTFNNLHAWIDKGTAAIGSGYPKNGQTWTHDRLMKPAEDELSSHYGLLAESIKIANDNSWVAFTLRQDATWHDGKPVSVDDVLWTFDTLKKDAAIAIKSAYRDVERVEQTGPWSFKFHFREEAEKTRRLVVQMTGFMPLPKHYWQDRDFTSTTLQPPLGNGPYRIAEVQPGRKIVYERVPDYWGRDLSVNAGYYNFERLVYFYFRDKKIALQALKARVFDFYREQNERDFATAYDFPAAEQGLFKKVTFQSGMSYGMHYGVVFNTRLQKLSDVRVREALTLAYNFDWANRTLWYGALERNLSFFSGSGLESHGLPTPAELELLEPFRGQIPDRVFTDEFKLPENDGYGRNREALLQAHTLLEDAGWVLDRGVRRHQLTGKQLELEFVVRFLEHERMLTPFAENLKHLGIESVLRKVEPNTYTNRLRNYDFEVVVEKIYHHPIPLPQWIRSFFLSENADRPNTWNWFGLDSEAADFLVEKITSANTEEEMNVAGRALDRVLQWSFILIPDGRPTGRHLVYWDRLGSPKLGKESMNWTGFPILWWFDQEKSSRVDAAFDTPGSR